MNKLLIARAGLAGLLASTPAFASEQIARNKAIVKQSFDDWAAGTGGPYALLDDNATWEITGNSAAAKKYPRREAFMTEVIRPSTRALRHR